MTSLSRRFLSLFTLALLAAFCSARGDTQKRNIPRFSDDTAALYKAASDVTPPPGSDILVLDNEASYVFDADGKSVRSAYFLFKVLTPRGEQQWNNISLNWEGVHLSNSPNRPKCQ